jgi:VWFA-related protein
MRILTALLLLPAMLLGQQKAPVFRATTQLVEFTFIALDKQGKAVTDLRQEEVLIYENGKLREPAFFRFEGEPTPTRQPEPLPAGIFSNRIEYAPGPPRNISAIVLDTLNTLPADMMRVRAQVTRYLRRLAPQTRIAVFLLGTNLRVLHDFADNVDSLRSRIEKTVLPLPSHAPSDIDSLARDAEQLLNMFPNDPQLEEMLLNQIEIEGLYNAAGRKRRMDVTLAALETMGDHLSGIPGRKNLIWIGGGISMLSITGAMGFGVHGGFESYEDRVRTAAQHLAQKGVTLYAVDSRPLSGPKEMSALIAGPQPVRGRGRFAPQQQAEETSADPLPAAFKIAGITGGRVITNTNDAATGMERAAQDLLGAYSLAFYAGGDPDGKWHSLKVKVNRPGVRGTSREGFLASIPVANPTEWSADQWRSAVHNPLASTAISLDARCESAPDAESGNLTLQLRIDPSQLHLQPEGDQTVAKIEIGIAEKAAAGVVRFHHESGSISLMLDKSATSVAERYHYTKTWKPSEGLASIRIVVRDKATGRFGTLDLQPSRIPSVPRHP